MRAGRAVYLRHCDRGGHYSLYSSDATNQNYLRGVQQADAAGTVSFLTVFPGAYPGRWPHMHFEVFPSLSAATNVSNKVATSQIALPKTASDLVYATTGYETSVRNPAGVSLATDDVASGFTAAPTVTVAGSEPGGAPWFLVPRPAVLVAAPTSGRRSRKREAARSGPTPCKSRDPH